MIREAICEGLNVQEALKKAKDQLGLDDTAEYELEIIQTEEKKKFGLFGGRPAKVRVFIKDTPDERAEKFLRDVGRRGETLDALQYITSLVANHGEEPYIKVTVNTGNYREKREKTLEILGRKLAFKAIKTGRKTSLEPMNPYERRIIHTAVQKVNGAISWSEGENAARHVVIGPDPKVKNNRKGGYQNNRRGGGRRSYGGGKKQSSTAPVNPDRVPLNEGGETGLYGRIK